MQAEVLQYLDQNKDRFLSELFDFLRIPSISADRTKKDSVVGAAHFLMKQFAALKADVVELWETEGYPVVYAEKIIDPNAPTVLMYGHYDVQPVDPLNLWTTPPFEPEIRDGKIYARGAADDKGQVYMHLKAFETMQSLGKLPVNLKFFIEGEEEVGSDNLEACLRKYQDRLGCDVLLISDTSMISMEDPSLSVGLRGLAYMEVEVTGPSHDLHSGVFGGAVGNPANILAKMITQLKDENNRVTIPGFYDAVVELSAEDRAELARIPFNEIEYKRHLDIAATEGEKGYTVIEQTTIRPTLDVNGIWGGYTGEGSKTVLPSKASAKISMRLVPNQNSHKIAELFEKHFKSLAPASVKVKVTHHHGGEPFVTDTKSMAYQAASAAVEQSFGKKPIPARDGGSIPIMALFQQVLQKPIVLMGFGLNTDAIHSPNEHYGVFNFLKGIETICLFYKNFSVKK